MALKSKSGANKGAGKRSTKAPASGSTATAKRKSSIKSAAPRPTQHKPKPRTAVQKPKKPLHLRYSEKQLGVPQLNGIRPSKVQKLPKQKKGKHFVDDGEGMRTILAMVMAEKEGNIESKMMRARQLEEIREAKRAEAEKRAESKKAVLEEKKSELKGKKRRVGARDSRAQDRSAEVAYPQAKKSKRVSFG